MRVSLCFCCSVSHSSTVNEKGNGDLALIEEEDGGNVQAISRNPPAECT